MSVDYFAHCAFGVRLGGPSRAAFDAAFRSAQSRLADDYFRGHRDESDPTWTASERADEWYGLEDESLTLVLQAMEADGSAATVRAMVGAPPQAAFFFTGDEDDRPGRCYAGPDEVLCGFGPFAALGWARDRFSAEHREAVEFHSWVEAG